MKALWWKRVAKGRWGACVFVWRKVGYVVKGLATARERECCSSDVRLG